MSTATKVAIATTAGAVAATAAGLATSDKGRELRRTVTRKVKDLVNQGSITLKKSGIGDVVCELEHMIGEMLTGGRGRNESRSDDNQSMISTRGSGSRRSR